MELRDYQRKALDDLYAWFGQHEGNPCIEAPTGSGKSMIIAQFCKENLERNPEMRILLATHMKELIEQDYKAIKRHGRRLRAESFPLVSERRKSCTR